MGGRESRLLKNLSLDSTDGDLVKLVQTSYAQHPINNCSVQSSQSCVPHSCTFALVQPKRMNFSRGGRSLAPVLQPKQIQSIDGSCSLQATRHPGLLEVMMIGEGKGNQAANHNSHKNRSCDAKGEKRCANYWSCVQSVP